MSCKRTEEDFSKGELFWIRWELHVQVYKSNVKLLKTWDGLLYDKGFLLYDLPQHNPTCLPVIEYNVQAKGWEDIAPKDLRGVQETSKEEVKEWKELSSGLIVMYTSVVVISLFILIKTFWV